MLVYISPRSIPAFLVFAAAAGLPYFLNIKKGAKLGLAVLVAVVLVPILGARNIFYLEVIFQIAVFSALALGLNIVVGFSGLLNFGYMAFYAVGAYLWAFFGSQQPFLLHAIPGTAPPGTSFFLAADWFYLFIFLGVIVAAIVGSSWACRFCGYAATTWPSSRWVSGNRAPAGQQPGQARQPDQRAAGNHAHTATHTFSGVIRFFNGIFEPLVGRPVTENQFYNILFYLIALVVVIVAVIITYRLDDSKVGRAWTAVREDELAATAMGIPANKLKLGAFAVGASFAGAMGCPLCRQPHLRQPRVVQLLQSVSVLTMVILGGIGSIRASSSGPPW